MNIIERIRRHQSDGGPILENIDLKGLRYFIATAEAGSITRAAERLDIAQSHLSRQIMRLEAALGHRLFVRRARHVELTDVGQVLQRESKAIFAKLDTIPERMNEARGGSVGSLCIGFTTAASFHPMTAKMIEEITRQEPRIVLKFCVESRPHLIDAILDRRIQACFVNPPPCIPFEICIDTLVTEPVLLAVHKNHRLASRDQIDIKEIATEHFVLCERSLNPELYDDTIIACQRAGFSPRVIFHAPDPVSALLLAAAGVGVTMVATSVRSVHAQDLHFIALAGNIINIRMALLTRSDEHLAGVKLLRKRALEPR
jgi:DNA-binding transcriptional LysR family regulator